MSKIVGKMFLNLLVNASFHLYTICPILFRQQEDALTFGGSLTRLISLRTEFWSPCQPYKHLMESLLTCIFWVHQYVCHFIPGNSFSHPRCKCVIWFCLPLASVPPLPGGKAGSMTQLREMIQNVVVRWWSKEYLYVCSSYAGCSLSLPSPETMEQVWTLGSQNHGIEWAWKTLTHV